MGAWHGWEPLQYNGFTQSFVALAGGLLCIRCQLSSSDLPMNSTGTRTGRSRRFAATKMEAEGVSTMVLGDDPVWQAHYAWSPVRGGPGLAVRLFRRVFSAPGGAESFRIHVSADSRYRLWLNGRAIGFGPAKGSLARYHFETYEIAGLLRPGRNVLAAEVRHFGENCPKTVVHSPVPGWLVQGPAGAKIDTPEGWRVWDSGAVTPDTSPYIDNAHIFLNHLEHLDTRAEPVGWRTLEFDDGAWSEAVSTGPAAATESVWGVAPMRTLTPRDIGPMHESVERFARTIQDRVEVAHAFDGAGDGWTLAAGEGGSLLLDAGAYATGFPSIDFVEGEDREVRVTYAESLGYWQDVDGRRVWCKHGARDDFTNGVPHGYRDTIILRGGEYHWEPFYWRAFRYVQIDVLPGPEPIRVCDAVYRLCVHPQAFSARFDSSDPQAASIFAVSQRTLRVGAHENYDDSPYYEQLSYIADTRMEALGSLHLCNETALPRRNLRLFLDTLRPDGLLDARVPCQYARQTIPYFCLHWILMVEDYWRWVGSVDASFVRECLVAVDTILIFFRSRLRSDGFVGVTGGWNMVDAVEEWPNGQPPSVVFGGSTYLSCLVVEAMQAAVRLHRQAGYAPDARRWDELSRQMKRKIRERAWDAKAGLFAEGVGRRCDRSSQHTQAGAINAGVATPAQMRRIARRLATDDSLIQANSMQSFYVARALEKAGAYAGFHSHLLKAWRSALDKGLTTWPEYPDPCRSDSHAWAAWPAVDYVTVVLGVRPATAGWGGIQLAPQVDGLDWARGCAPCPAGMIEVEWRKSGRHLEFSAVTPAGLSVDVNLPGGAHRRFARGGTIEWKSLLPSVADARRRGK